MEIYRREAYVVQCYDPLGWVESLPNTGTKYTELIFLSNRFINYSKSLQLLNGLSVQFSCSVVSDSLQPHE